MPNRPEILMTDMRKAFGPAENLSSVAAKGKWRAVFYETDDISGWLLSAMPAAHPGDITCRPGLSGYYRIYLLVYRSATIFLKLKNDRNYDCVCPGAVAGPFVEEFLWRCADMTGEEITLTCSKVAASQASILFGLRFVPMSEEEVRFWQADREQTRTRTMYAESDMHYLPYSTRIDIMDDWLETIDSAKDSDVEYMSFEETRHFFSGKCPVPLDQYAFCRTGDRLVEEQVYKFDYDQVLKKVCNATRAAGAKPVIAIRMGAWGLFYPLDQCYFDCPFFLEHPELRCVERDGSPTSKMSYAYKEVRDYMIRHILHAAESGCDAVALIGHRAPAYFLYEKPVVDQFRALYGEDPCQLPLDDPRLNKIHCNIMTGFFRELRAALDEKFGRHKVKIHLRALFCLESSRYVGFDCEALAKEGLVDLVVSYPDRIYEVLDPTVWADEQKTRIDLAKFHTSLVAGTSIIRKDGNLNFAPPFRNSRGQFIGPETQAQRIAEWERFGAKYNIPIYYDIFPRIIPCAEFKRRAAELYDLGAKHLSLWDTPIRVWNRPMWNAVRALGHKETLNADSFYEKGYKVHTIRSYNGIMITRFTPSWGG